MHNYELHDHNLTKLKDLKIYFSCRNSRLYTDMGQLTKAPFMIEVKIKIHLQKWR